MATKKSEKKMEEKTTECKDKFCPWHGKEKLKLRGRTFEGEVITKLAGRVTIQFERMLKVEKYDRYEKRKTKVHARLTDCMKDKVNLGDLVQVTETRPISKMIHFVVTQVRKTKQNNMEGKNESN